jgi:small subunit ribosomal protein S3
MGQKTHPLGFRLGITQEHKSIWYSNLNKYTAILKEDDKIRTYIKTISKKNWISNVQINRNGLKNQIQINIETGDPAIVVGDLGTSYEKLLEDIKKILPEKLKLTIKIIPLEKINIQGRKKVRLNASLCADLIANDLETRVPFKTAMRKVLQDVQEQNVNGIKIQVSGRLNGAEIARSEWIRKGRVPLQTLRADIDYATQEAYTIYGVLGIKVWLFKSEILSK